jgi:5-methylcytosine-specific restriction protein B
MFKLFRKPETSNDKKVNSAADDIRKYVKSTYVTPARQRGDKTITFSASDIHAGMDTKEPFNTICGAIDAKKFEDFARVKLVKRTGSKQGAAAKWIFDI